MPARGRRSMLCALAAFALFAAMLLALPSLALASSTGSGGWYWPVGTENFQGWDGWWVHRTSNHSWHMAQDMPAPVGHPVYAVGDGIVLESKPDSGYGGVLVILHRTLEGTQFKAVYGHITRKSLAKGDHVVAGQVVGTVNHFAHVHFGIHPGRAYPPDRNPFRGHTYDPKVTYGWVDPVKFLRANPRRMAYKAPALPRVTVVTATVSPTFLGVAASKVYYSVTTPERVTQRYRRPLTGGAPSEIPSGAALPSLDTKRFSAIRGTSGWMAVYDRLPRLTVSYSSKAPSWHAAVAVTGGLANRSGAVFCGARIVLQRASGTAWATVASTTTGPHGRYWMSYKPDRRCTLRVRFLPPKTFIPASTAGAIVAPRPGLCAPSVPAHVEAGHAFAIVGTLRARHTAGSHTVMLQFQRLSSGRWVSAFARTTTNHDANGATQYKRVVSLASGKWRVRATILADSVHAPESTRWVAILPE